MFDDDNTINDSWLNRGALRRMVWIAGVVSTVLWLGGWLHAGGVRADDGKVPGDNRVAPHYPCSLVLDESAHRLYVANRCGTISVLDTHTGRVQSEVRVGKRLVRIVRRPGRAGSPCELLAVDEAAHRLLVLRPTPSGAGTAAGSRSPTSAKLEVVRSIPVSRYPVSVVCSERGDMAYVASLWSRRVSGVSLETGEIKWQRDLAFAPRELCLLSDAQRLLVADAFGDRIGVVDSSSGHWVRTVHVPGNAFRGMAVSRDGRRLILAQKLLNELARTDRDDIHWGLLMSNDLRWLRLDLLLKGSNDLIKESFIHPLGEPSRAAADPEGVVMTKRGVVVATIGGVGEIAYGRQEDYILRRLRVGRRPTGLVADDSGRMIYVADTLSDAIAVVDLEREQLVATWRLGPQRPPSLVERGEQLFYVSCRRPHQPSAQRQLERWELQHVETRALAAGTSWDGAAGLARNATHVVRSDSSIADEDDAIAA